MFAEICYTLPKCCRSFAGILPKFAEFARNAHRGGPHSRLGSARCGHGAPAPARCALAAGAHEAAGGARRGVPGGGAAVPQARPRRMGPRLCFSNCELERISFLTFNFISNFFLTFRKSSSENFKIFVAKSEEI